VPEKGGVAEPTAVPLEKDVAPPVRPARGYRPPAGGWRLRLPRDRVADLEASCAALLHCHPACQPGPSGENFFTLVADILSNPLTNKVGDSAHRGHYTVHRDGEEAEIDFDEVGFLDAFVAAHLAPRSRALVELPRPPGWTGDARYVDVTASPLFGARGFGLRLYAGRRGADDEPLPLVPRLGWWNEWFSLLFDRRSDVLVRFAPVPGGFRLAAGKLAHDRLGLGGSAATYQGEMWF
jgi:hypothetical protein